MEWPQWWWRNLGTDLRQLQAGTFGLHLHWSIHSYFLVSEIRFLFFCTWHRF
jgi:hypothetical protein